MTKNAQSMPKSPSERTEGLSGAFRAGPIRNRPVARLAKKAGISRRVHPHMLRHTALTDLYDRTHDLRMTQQVAGHSSSRMTERYTHVRPVDVARAMGAIVEEEAPS